VLLGETVGGRVILSSLFVCLSAFLLRFARYWKVKLSIVVH
jgi:hypothetical protein